MLREWRKIQEDLGLPDMTVHELRHTTGTLLLSAGVPLEVVSAILRHASIRVTKDIYAKVEEPLTRPVEWTLSSKYSEGHVARQADACLARGDGTVAVFDSMCKVAACVKARARVE